MVKMDGHHYQGRSLAGEGCLKLKPTLSHTEVPLLWREPNILLGFRPINEPWHYYVRSLFQMHNETMNIWTHLIGACVIFVQLLKFTRDVDFINDPYAWSFLVGIMCAVALYLCSCAAHTMQSMSEVIHYLSFMVDYTGIGIYSLGSVIVHFEYCSEPNFHAAVRPWFIALGCIMAYSICFCCIYAKVRYQRPYPVQRKLFNCIPIILIYILLVSPVVHRLYTCFVYKEDCNNSIPYHAAQIVFFILSGFFYASELPQKLLPMGYCDHFFHSHQLFHIAISSCTYMQMEAVYRDFHERSDFLRSHQAPTLLYSTGPVLLTVLLEIFTMFIFVLIVLKKVKKVNNQKQD